MTLLAVKHVTTYRYTRPVSFGEHRMMFRPRDSFDQKLIEATLGIAPKPIDIRWMHDVFGNCVAFATFGEPSEELRFESNILVDHRPTDTPDFQLEDYARNYPFSYDADEMPDLLPAIARQYPDHDHEVQNWVQRFVSKGRPTDIGKLLMTLTYAIKESFTYERRITPGTREPSLTLKLGYGSCRDFAVLMMEAVRSLGLAARFVSGYLYVPSRDGPRHLGGGSTHAWCQVYLPGSGWVEFDPTNGIVGNRDLIRVAVARDPSQAIPLIGTFDGERSDYDGMTVEVRVRAVDESSLATPPPSIAERVASA
jgi:transglutaminase-like putative cysteine protease